LSNKRIRSRLRAIYPYSVGALCLEQAGEHLAAQTLEAYLDVFTHHYLQAKHQQPPDRNGPAHVRLRALAAAAA
jgi:hypothetical protein